MSKLILRTAIFFSCLAAWAFIWWLAGYDFDRRGFDIAYFFVIAIATSFGIAIGLSGWKA